MPRLTNPNPATPTFAGESRVVDSPTKDLTPPGHSRAVNGSAVPNGIDTSLQDRAQALMDLGWRFDPAGTEVGPAGTYQMYQATAPQNGSTLLGYGFADCVRLAEARQADYAHKAAIGFPGF